MGVSEVLDKFFKSKLSGRSCTHGALTVSFKGFKLNRRSFVGDCELPIAGAELEVSGPVGENLEKKVFVKTLTGKTISCMTSWDATVQHLKAIIHEKEGIPEDQQRLIFGGLQMEDGRELAECGVIHESVVHLVLRLRGT